MKLIRYYKNRSYLILFPWRLGIVVRMRPSFRLDVFWLGKVG